MNTFVNKNYRAVHMKIRECWKQDLSETYKEHAWHVILMHFFLKSDQSGDIVGHQSFSQNGNKIIVEAQLYYGETELSHNPKSC